MEGTISLFITLSHSSARVRVRTYTVHITIGSTSLVSKHGLTWVIYLSNASYDISIIIKNSKKFYWTLKYKYIRIGMTQPVNVPGGHSGQAFPAQPVQFACIVPIVSFTHICIPGEPPIEHAFASWNVAIRLISTILIPDGILKTILVFL